MLSEYIMIGQVLKPQGIQGLVKILPLTDNPERFIPLKQVYINRSNQYFAIIISNIRVHSGFVYCALDGAASRERAESQRDIKLYVDRGNAIRIPDDTNYVCDMIDCEVYDYNGTYIGKLVEIFSTGANDVYVLETAKGKMLFPALKHVIKSVDIVLKKILVDEERLLEVAVFED